MIRGRRPSGSFATAGAEGTAMTYRGFGLAASVVQLVLMTGDMVLETIYGPGFWYAAVGFFGILVFPAVGLAILARHPRHLVGLLFCVSQLGWAVNNVAGSYARAGVLPFSSVAVWLYVWPGLISSAVLVVLLLVFPDGHFLSARWRRLGVGVLATSGVVTLATAVAPGPVDPSIGMAVDNPFGLPGLVGDIAAAVSSAGYPLVIPMFILAAVSMVRRYRRSGTLQREQLKWFASSVVLTAVLAAGALALMAFYPNPETAPLWVQAIGQVAILSVSFVPVAAAVAIFRYRLYDIDILIRRSLIYGSVLAVLAAAYVTGIVLVQSVLRPFTTGSEISVATSTLVTLALFQPLRSRIQRMIDRRFYRARYDTTQTLDKFSVRLRDQVALEALRSDLLDVVRTTMQPAHASVWLRERMR